VSRRRAKLLAVTGSVLTALVGGLWVLSIRWQIGWSGSSRDGWLTWIFVASGSLEIHRFGDFSGMIPGPGWYSWADLHWPTRWLPCYQRYNSNSNWMAAMPLWIPLLTVAVPTSLFVRALRRRGSGLCSACGYDMTGLPTIHARVCPECGTGRTA
jgi:hypothetical protein